MSVGNPLEAAGKIPFCFVVVVVVVVVVIYNKTAFPKLFTCKLLFFPVKRNTFLET